MQNNKIENIFNMPKLITFDMKKNKISFDDKSLVIYITNDFNISGLQYEHTISKRLKTDVDYLLIENKNILHVYETTLPNEIGTKFILLNIPKNSNNNVFAITHLISQHLKKLNLCENICIVKLDEISDKNIDYVLKTLLSHNIKMPSYKSKKISQYNINSIYLQCDSINKDVINSNFGNGLSRYLTTLPTNILRPKSYLNIIKNLSKNEGWKIEVFNKTKLEKESANAFLAVARSCEDAVIVKLSYVPTGSNEKLLSLVGKGVCYDTGGINVKPPAYMFGMHEDMSGSSVALGNLLMLSRSKVDYKIECWLALVENNIDANCYVPNEVITASNGVTIEVVDTDAEGRMILCDTLVLANKSNPDLIIDFATLTGSAVRSVGNKYSAVFSNREDNLLPMIISGKNSAENVWGFPMTDDYLANIKSDIADIKQCSTGASSDHIDAAKFLEMFVNKDTNWIHYDMSASMHKGGLGAVATDFTGHGVWFTQDYLKNNF